MTDRSTPARSLAGTALACLLAVAAGVAVAWLDERGFAEPGRVPHSNEARPGEKP